MINGDTSVSPGYKNSIGRMAFIVKNNVCLSPKCLTAVNSIPLNDLFIGISLPGAIDCLSGRDDIFFKGPILIRNR
jgi:hypothetical protein